MSQMRRGRPGGRKRILVAEDDQQLAKLVGHILQRAGYEVVLVDNGIAALTELARSPDIGSALLDVEMPGLDGVSVAWALAARAPELEVFIMSGLSLAEVRGRLGGLLVAGVLVKPFGQRELLQLLA